MRSRSAGATTWTPEKPSSTTGPSGGRTVRRTAFASSTRPRRPVASKRRRREVGRSITASVASGARGGVGGEEGREREVGVDVHVVEEDRAVAAEEAAGGEEAAAGLEGGRRLAGERRPRRRSPRARARRPRSSSANGQTLTTRRSQPGGDEPPRDALEHGDAADGDERLRHPVGDRPQARAEPRREDQPVHVRASRASGAGSAGATRGAVAIGPAAALAVLERRRAREGNFAPIARASRSAK